MGIPASFSRWWMTLRVTCRLRAASICGHAIRTQPIRVLGCSCARPAKLEKSICEVMAFTNEALRRSHRDSNDRLFLASRNSTGQILSEARHFRCAFPKMPVDGNPCPRYIGCSGGRQNPALWVQKHGTLGAPSLLPVGKPVVGAVEIVEMRKSNQESQSAPLRVGKVQRGRDGSSLGPKAALKELRRRRDQPSKARRVIPKLSMTPNRQLSGNRTFHSQPRGLFPSGASTASNRL